MQGLGGRHQALPPTVGGYHASMREDAGGLTEEGGSMSRVVSVTPLCELKCVRVCRDIVTQSKSLEGLTQSSYCVVSCTEWG